MKRTKVIASLAIFLSFTALTFALPRETIRSALRGMTSAIRTIVGSCSREDAPHVQMLLQNLSRCQLTGDLIRSTDWNRAQACIESTLSRWRLIQSSTCKADLRRDVESVFVENLQNQWEFVIEAEDSTEFKRRLEAYLDHLSYWENATRNPLYLDRTLLALPGPEAGGAGAAALNLTALYRDFSEDLNAIHAEMARGFLEKMRRSFTDFDDYQRKNFMEKTPAYDLILNKLYSQANPGPISLIHFTHLALKPLMDRTLVLLNLLELSCATRPKNHALGTCQREDYENSEPYIALLLTSLLTASDAQMRDHSPTQLLNQLQGALGATAIFEPLFENRDRLLAALRVGMTNQDIRLDEADLHQFEGLALPLV
jgi:hypothetical protein